MTRLATTALAFVAIELFAINTAVAEEKNAPASGLISVADSRESAIQAEQCIRNNVFRVEAAVGDLAQATKFLVEDICAVPIAKENADRMAKQTEVANAQWQKMCDDEKTSPESDKSKDASAVAFDACSMVKITRRVGVVNTTAYVQDVVDPENDYMFVGRGSPAEVALASSLLLDLRLSHSKSGTAH